MKKRLVAFLLVPIMVLGMLPVSALAADDGISPQALNTGHKIDVTFTVLYVGDEFNIGYNTGASEKTQFVCQYSTPHSDTAYNNHTIAISDIKAAADRASVNSGYQIVGWSKESNANPTVWPLNKSGDTACNKGTTIYLVAKNPNPEVTYTLNYYKNTTDTVTNMPAPNPQTETSSTGTVTFTVSDKRPERADYTFLGWAGNPGATTPTVQPGNWVTTTATTTKLYAVWQSNTPPTDKPAKPTALDGSFAIVCKNNEATHAYKADYIATPRQYTISDVQKDEQGYYVTATVTVAPNLAAYNNDTRVEHRLVDEQDATLTITFRYDTEATGDGNRKWQQQGDLPVVEVICKPKAPTADELKKLEMAVQVKCVVDASQQHTAAYGLLGECDVDYFVFEPRQEGDDWLCDISYYPERYVAEFNTTFQNLKHVQNDEKIVPVTLIWAGDSWQLKTQGRVHVTEVYTVTYTDGVDGEEVFADQVYSDLRKDSTTPAFNGTPTRTGYTFAGWEPEVAATVTQTVTYVAKWEAKKANVHLMIFKSGDLSKPIVDVPYAADKLAGDTIDLTKIDPSSYLDFDFEIDGGWYDDGMFNSYKRYLDGLQDKPAGLEKLLITGNWQNLKLIVTELVPVVYFDSLESLTAYQNDHSKTEGILRTTKARVGSALPTADAPTATRNGYTFTFCTYRNNAPRPLTDGGSAGGSPQPDGSSGDRSESSVPAAGTSGANAPNSAKEGYAEVAPGHFVKRGPVRKKQNAGKQGDTQRLTYMIPPSAFNDTPDYLKPGAPETVRNAVTAKTYLIIAVAVFVLSLAAMITIITVRYTPVELSLANYPRYMSYNFYLNTPATGTSFTVDLTVTNKSDRNLEISATWEMTTEYKNNGETRTTTVSRDFTLSPERSITMNNVASGTFSNMSVSLKLIEIRGYAR